MNDTLGLISWKSTVLCKFGKICRFRKCRYILRISATLSLSYYPFYDFNNQSNHKGNQNDQSYILGINRKLFEDSEYECVGQEVFGWDIEDSEKFSKIETNIEMNPDFQPTYARGKRITSSTQWQICKPGTYPKRSENSFLKTVQPQPVSYIPECICETTPIKNFKRVKMTKILK